MQPKFGEQNSISDVQDQVQDKQSTKNKGTTALTQISMLLHHWSSLSIWLQSSNSLVVLHTKPHIACDHINDIPSNDISYEHLKEKKV